jgi:hypothetical protein
MENKYCPRCESTLPSDRFGDAKDRGDGKVAYCKSCTSAYRKDRDDVSRRSQFLTDTQKYIRKAKLEVMTHYCDGEPHCVCCGESNFEFLSFDHINGGGRKHREEIKSYQMPYWLKKNGYPEGFRVLCHNCNQSYGMWGYCPHQLANGHASISVVKALLTEPRGKQVKENIKVAAWGLFNRGDYPSCEKVAKESNHSRSTVFKYTKELVSEGQWPAV